MVDFIKDYFIELALVLIGIVVLVLGFVVNPYIFSAMGLHVLYVGTNISTIKKLNKLLKPFKPCDCYDEFYDSL